MTAPVKIFAPGPQYSPLARAARIQGVVIVELLVTKEGDAKNIKALRGLPMCLTEEVVRTVRAWKFKPARLDGEPVDQLYNVTINYRTQ